MIFRYLPVSRFAFSSPTVRALSVTAFTRGRRSWFFRPTWRGFSGADFRGFLGTLALRSSAITSASLPYPSMREKSATLPSVARICDSSLRRFCLSF